MMSHRTKHGETCLCPKLPGCEAWTGQSNLWASVSSFMKGGETFGHARHTAEGKASTDPALADKDWTQMDLTGLCFVTMLY